MLSAVQFGKNQADAMLRLQKEVLGAYEEVSRAWLARVKSEIDFWSDMSSKLTASPSMPDGLAAYRDCLSRRMQMAAEDGRRLFENGQKIINAFTHAASGHETSGASQRPRSS
jgi:hypothetical protein